MKGHRFDQLARTLARRAGGISAATVSPVPAVVADPTAPAVTVINARPAVGEPVTDFALRSTRGAESRLADLRGRKRALLIFAPSSSG